MKSLGVLCLLAVWSSAMANSCNEPCKCGNITFEKASKAFSNVLQNTTSGKNQYYFWVSPCSPITCNSTNTSDTSGGAAGCQHIDRGKSDPEYITLGLVGSPTWNFTSENFTVCYGDGDANGGLIRRVCIVFTVTDVKEPQISFVTEDDITSPNFHDYVFAVQLPKGDATGGSKVAPELL